ncbi:hypothetical protein OIDMADRAFT_62360 [Oidiodendron maius Zn]|uniref:Uncharacterized protein n=1 Tax=Oidiodendron maius (strain Zn) TaxID=913774 RepID=A0A0C3C1G6_OIDMZ|nr:hypothetical protein OIDMADRAFT_62360 [Oidiodendron maius Zn]
MVAFKKILLAAASFAALTEGKPVGHFFKNVVGAVKREHEIRGSNDIWVRKVDATHEIARAFPKCEALMDLSPVKRVAN